MHEFHLFAASLGIGLALAVRWELHPVLAGLFVSAIRSAFILLGY